MEAESQLEWQMLMMKDALCSSGCRAQSNLVFGAQTSVLERKGLNLFHCIRTQGKPLGAATWRSQEFVFLRHHFNYRVTIPVFQSWESAEHSWGLPVSGALRATVWPALNICQEEGVALQGWTSPEEAFQREHPRRQSFSWLLTCHFASACVVCKRYREETHLSDYPNKHVVECSSEVSWLTPNHGAEDNSFGWSWIDSDWPAFHVSGKSLWRALPGEEGGGHVGTPKAQDKPSKFGSLGGWTRNRHLGNKSQVLPARNKGQRGNGLNQYHQAVCHGFHQYHQAVCRDQASCR